MRSSKRILKRFLAAASAALFAVGVLSIGGNQRSMEKVKAAEPSVDAASSVNYSTILGRASNYGLLANKIDQTTSHMETTIAVKTLNQSGQANEIDLCGKEPVWIMVGELETPTCKLDFGQRIHKDIDTAGGEKMIYYLDTTQAVYDQTETSRSYQDIRASLKSKDEINNSIKTMQDNSLAWSSTLSGKEALDISTMSSVDAAGKFIINIPDTYADKTIYINVDDYSGLISSLNTGGGSKLLINKPESTVIVFNYNATDVTISDFEVNGLGTAQDCGGDDSEKNQKIDKNICQKIIWNLPNATTVTLKKAVGLFLVPKTTANVNVADTAAGWVSTYGTVNVTSEFHYIYHGRSAGYDNQFQFGGTKALTKTLSKENAEADQVSTIEINADDFSFELYETDSTYNTSGLTPILTTSNAANSEFRFDYITYDSEGTHYYVIKEKNQGETKNHITNSDGEIDIKLDVSIDANGTYKYTVSSEKYVTAADKSAGKSISTNNNKSADGTVFTFGRFYNKVDVGNLEIIVTDEETGAPVSGVKVKVKNPSGSSKEYTTDANGKIEIKDTLAGNYDVVVTDVPANSRVTTGETATVTVRNNEIAQHQAKITSTGGLKVTVYDEVSGDPVKDVEVKITDKNGNYKKYTTDANGEILVNPTDTGDYEIEVISVPAGKKVTVGEKKTVSVTKGVVAEHTAMINNTETGNLEITVKDEKTDNPVPEAKVDVTNSSGISKSYTTDTNGKISITNIPTGNYTIEVTDVPSGYSVTTGQKTDVSVKKNETTKEEVKLKTATSTDTPSKTPDDTSTVTTSSNSKTNTSNTVKAIQTGDNFNVKTPIMLLIISLMGIAALIYGKKKYDIF